MPCDFHGFSLIRCRETCFTKYEEIHEPRFRRTSRGKIRMDFGTTNQNCENLNHLVRLRSPNLVMGCSPYLQGTSIIARYHCQKFFRSKIMHPGGQNLSQSHLHYLFFEFLQNWAKWIRIFLRDLWMKIHKNLRASTRILCSRWLSRDFASKSS